MSTPASSASHAAVSVASTAQAPVREWLCALVLLSAAVLGMLCGYWKVLFDVSVDDLSSAVTFMGALVAGSGLAFLVAASQLRSRGGVLLVASAVVAVAADAYEQLLDVVPIVHGWEPATQQVLALASCVVALFVVALQRTWRR